MSATDLASLTASTTPTAPTAFMAPAAAVGAGADRGGRRSRPGAPGQDRGVVVHLAGALDLASKARVTDLLAQARVLPVATLVLDLSEVTFIDCVGLGVLLGASADLGDRLQLRAPSTPVARLLALTDTHSHFDIAPASHPHPHPRDGDDHASALPATAQVVAELGQLTVDQPPRLLLQQAVDLAAGVLPGVDGLCLALAHEGHVLQAAFVGDLAASLDERQYGPDFGPCSHAARTGQPVDLDADTEADLDAAPDVRAVDDEGRPGVEGWADFAALARRKGVRAVHAVPVTSGQRVVGALVLYGTTTTGPIDPGARTAAHGFAHAAGGLLANVLLHRAALRKVGQLQEAMASRAVIEQAKGVLMAVHGIDADTAFDRLAHTSQATNTKLRDLAADILARTRQ